MAPTGDSRLVTPSTVVARALGLPIDASYELFYDRNGITLQAIVSDHCEEAPADHWGGCNVRIGLTRLLDGKIRIEAHQPHCYQWESIHRGAGLGPVWKAIWEFLEHAPAPGDCTTKTFHFAPPDQQTAHVIVWAVLRAVGHDIPVPDPWKQAVADLQAGIALADATTFTKGERVSWVEGSGEQLGTPNPKERSVSYVRVAPSEGKKVHTGKVSSDGQFSDGTPPFR